MGYFQVRYDSRVVNYDHRGFIRLATGEANDQDILAPDCSSIHFRLLRQSKFKPCIWPGYFLLQSSDLMYYCWLEWGVHEHWCPQ